MAQEEGRSMALGRGKTVGVVIVAYRSEDVIIGCIDSLKASGHKNMRIVVVDNASPDASAALLQEWAQARGEPLADYPAANGPTLAGNAWLSLVRSAENRGFAGGVNLGLKALLSVPEVELFWVLNPDCTVRPDTAAAYAKKAAEAGRFGLMSGRTLYLDPPDRIQSDGSRVNMWTGVCNNIHAGMKADEVAPPAPAELDYFVGANVVASREFVETVGLMPEEYFLFYEEVEWALRRGPLPLVVCQEAVVHHHAGTAIGSKSLTRRPSGFANYFNYRNRLAFIRRNNRRALPVAYIYSMLKVAKLCLQRDWEGARGAFCGLNGLAPPPRVRAQLPENSAERAFELRP